MAADIPLQALGFAAMLQAAKQLDFERSILLRDEIINLTKLLKK